MKTINNETIEAGAKLIDVGTFSEFETFACMHLRDTGARKKLFDEVRKLMRADSRGRAIGYWREAAKSYREPDPSEPAHLARTILDAGGVKALTKEEMRRTEIMYGGIVGAAYIAGAAPEELERLAELHFAMAVTFAKKFDVVAKDLSVKLP